jgi:branched-chain amino acid transport system ATP-binding protein
MLKLDAVSGGYQDSSVVQGVTLTVDTTSVVALLGPNGAGKTTLLKMVSGLVPVTSGAVWLDGNEITGLTPAQRVRRGLCHIIEGRGVFPSLSVKENLLVFAPREAPESVIERAINAFPALGSRLRQTAGTLSGGEQQMLALTRAYASDAKLILIDEVSLGLAPKVLDVIFDFLAALAARGVALLIVEQYISRALALASDVYILNRGQVAVHMPAAELATREDEIFAQYLGSAVAG